MAAVIESWFRQDLQKPVQVHYLDGSLFSNNGNGNRIGVELTNGGEDYTVTGTVSGYAVLADGSTVPCTGAKSGNKASILVPPAAYLPGNIFITIFLTDGTTVTTLAAVSSTVIQARTDNQVSPGSVVTDWTNTINAAMQSVETAAANLGQVVATPYAQLTFPVPLGKYTYYNNNLYRCTTPIPSSEDFTAAHWSSALNLGDEVSDLKSAITWIEEITTDIYLKKEITSSAQADNYFFFPIIAGESYKITNNTTGVIYCGSYDINRISVESFPSTTAGNTRIITPTKNAKFFNLYCSVAGECSIERVDTAINEIDGRLQAIEDPNFQQVNVPAMIYQFNLPGLIKKLYDVDDFSQGDWRSRFVGLGYDVVYNKTDSKYYLLYSGNNGTVSSVGVATSTDMVNWTDYANNPVLAASSDSSSYDYGGATFPQLLWFDNKWLMFYVAYAQRGFESGTHVIAYAESTDLVNWTKKGVVLDGSEFASAGYNIGVFYRPRVRCYFGRYYMFINAGLTDASPGGSDESVYVAVSDNPTTGWKIIGKAMDATVESAGYNYQMCADPEVIFNGDVFLMTFWGGGKGATRWCYSYPTEFPLVWHEFNISPTAYGRVVLAPVGDDIYYFCNNGGLEMYLYIVTKK